MSPRSRVLAANAVGMGLALTATAWLGATLVDRPAPNIVRPGAVDRTHVMDFSGHAVPRGPFRRILSSSLFTDRILLELVAPDRLAALSEESRRDPRLVRSLEHLGTANSFGPVESMLALHPDLVILPNHGEPARAQQMRDAGIAVFELGQLHGFATFQATVTALGDLLDVPEAASAYLRGIDDRRRAVHSRRGQRPRPRGLYVSVMGSGLQGGTIGTSFHDVLDIAGADDVAADRFSGWPTYSAESVLSMGPRFFVTREGMGTQVCRFPGIEHASACAKGGLIVELPGHLLDDAGASIVDAADLLSRALFPENAVAPDAAATPRK